MDPGLVLERTKRSKKRLFSAMLRYFSRNLSGSHQNNALSCEKTPRFLYIPLFIQQALHYYKIVATNTAFHDCFLSIMILDLGVGGLGFFVSFFRFVDISDSSQPKLPNCHCVANKRKGFAANQLIVGKVVYGDVLGAEVQILRGAVEGIGFFGTVLRSQLAKADAVILYKSFCLKPQAVICCQKIERRHKCCVLLIILVKSCQCFIESQTMFFIYKCHWDGLAFFYISPESAKGTAMFDFRHCFGHDFFDRCNTNGNSFL